MNRRAFLTGALGGTAMLSGCVGSPLSAFDTAPMQRARATARDALRRTWSDSIRTIQTMKTFDGGYYLGLRWDLDYWSDAENVQPSIGERRALASTLAALRALRSVDVGDLYRVGSYAYVPSYDDGTAVHTKVVVDANELRDQSLEQYDWRRLRETAELYRFNEFLYDGAPLYDYAEEREGSQ